MCVWMLYWIEFLYTLRFTFQPPTPVPYQLRRKALAMGARYVGGWDATVTHCISAFAATPKGVQVEGERYTERER